MRHFNKTQGDLMRLFIIEFIHFLLRNTQYAIPQYGIQLSKLNGLGKTHRKRLCIRTETFARPFTTNKLFERIQLINEGKFH